MILVTGGGGFLGGAIIDRLLTAGEQVRSLGRRPQAILAAKGVDVLQGDCSNPAVVRRACNTCSAVFHVAAKAGVWGRYHDYHRSNILGTEAVLSACRAAGVRKLIYTSSPSVVFDGHDENGIDESTPYPIRYLNHYSATKAKAEQAVLAANSPDLATVSLRPHLIWGPGDPHLVPRLWQRAATGRLKLVTSSSHKLVDATYIDNAADAHIAAWRALQASAACAGRAYFIGNNEAMPMAQLINSLLAAGGYQAVTPSVSPSVAWLAGSILEYAYRSLGIRAEPRLTRFVARQLSTAHWFDLSAARRDLGYTPTISHTDGLARLAASHKGNT